MVTAFQVILLIIMLIAFMGSVGAKTKEERSHMTSIVIASIVAMVVMFLWL